MPGRRWARASGEALSGTRTRVGSRGRRRIFRAHRLVSPCVSTHLAAGARGRLICRPHGPPGAAEGPEAWKRPQVRGVPGSGVPRGGARCRGPRSLRTVAMTALLPRGGGGEEGGGAAPRGGPAPRLQDGGGA